MSKLGRGEFTRTDLCNLVGMTPWKDIQMAMPQGDDTIKEIKRLDALLEYAVVHIRLRRRCQVARRSVATEPRSGRKRPSDEAEAARLRARPHRINSIIHLHLSPQVESRCNCRARRGEGED